ncbi:hypothetical protein HMPREF0573_10138 [Mobiluncus curtisii ATCC 43063]|uniref:Uncharacterized protein n=1 Tax=Mobiluncus curtisii (strain ATCC 43063 / DSM 2711 / V125) TaxID=548479 RepID=D6ZIA8_MOBCV|nr:hypothetical protein HMPREF0573_10138 [Mobiluncus curtisii ATCC 43063]
MFFAQGVTTGFRGGTVTSGTALVKVYPQVAALKIDQMDTAVTKTL